MANISIRKSSYGEYSSNPNGAHTMRLEIGDLRLWFSYDTVVAFEAPGKARVVSENLWKTTTGKHLNWIDGGDKKNRVARPLFEKQLEDVLKACKLFQE